MAARRLLTYASLAVAAAWLSKPDASTFSAFFRRWLRRELSRDEQRRSKPQIVRWLTSALTSLAARATDALSGARFEDYGVCVVAHITLPGSAQELVFVGVFGTWVGPFNARLVPRLK